MLFKHKMAAPECDQSPCGTGMSYLKPSYDRTANIVHRAEFGAAQGDDLGTNKVRTSLVGYVWLLYYLFPCSLAPYLVPRSLSLLLRKSFRREDSRKICAIVSSDLGTHRRLAPCGCLVTIVTHAR